MPRRSRTGSLPALVRAALSALVAAGCGGGAADPGPLPDAATPPPALCTGGYHVCGGFLRDPEGRALILRGANLAGAHKLPPHLSFHQPVDFVRLRDDWGMSSIRFLLSWAAIEPSPGSYDEAYLDAVATRMQWAADAGLLVVLDMHQDVYGLGFVAGGGNGAPLWSCDQAHYDAFAPASSWFLNYGNEHVIACYDHFYADESTRARFVAAWGHVAERLAGEPAIVGFDVLNEPFWGSYPTLAFEADRLAPLYLEVVAAVRAAAPGWVAFLEPAASRNLGIASGLPPLGIADVVYAPHAYDSTAESGQGFSEERRKAYVDNVAALASEAQALGAALWIGEYGGYGDGLEAYMDAAYDAAGAVAAGNMLWSYDIGGSYSMLLADGSENAALLAAVVRPYPMRVAGDPVAWSYDEQSGVFVLELRPDARIDAPTEIALPPRLYPDGAEVECGGCTVELAPGVARLGGVRATTVTITPR